MEKDFDKWNEIKKNTHNKNFDEYIHEREVWWCSLGLNIGSEEDGKNELFERPVLILKKFNRDMILVIPLSSKVKDNKYYINFSYNNEESSALISQIKLISTKRLLRKIRKMDSKTYKEILKAVKDML